MAGEQVQSLFLAYLSMLSPLAVLKYVAACGNLKNEESSAFRFPRSLKMINTTTKITAARQYSRTASRSCSRVSSFSSGTSTNQDQPRKGLWSATARYTHSRCWAREHTVRDRNPQTPGLVNLVAIGYRVFLGLHLLDQLPAWSSESK